MVNHSIVHTCAFVTKVWLHYVNGADTILILWCTLTNLTTPKHRLGVDLHLALNCLHRCRKLMKTEKKTFNFFAFVFKCNRITKMDKWSRQFTFVY